jgi:hypothetical protein
VEASTSQNPMGLHDLLQGQLCLLLFQTAKVVYHNGSRSILAEGINKRNKIVRVEWVSRLFRIPEVLISNLGPDSCYAAIGEIFH